ncbi:Cys-tRNA(Pro) deacylase [Parelusimicrobium proximum]|uniref:YbaK/EbsC family protein n=1 Tax=Parelusimicrobium proximum TaxID=3228953 RepID=UPI003D1682AC
MIPEKVDKVLKNNGLEAITFGEGETATSVLAAAKLGVAVGQIAKSIVFKRKDGTYLMVLLAGDKKTAGAKMKALAAQKCDMASAEDTFAATGFKIGGVCPFGVDNMDIFIDVSLKEYDCVYPAAGTNSSGVKTTFDELLKVTRGRECDVTQ